MKRGGCDCECVTDVVAECVSMSVVEVRECGCDCERTIEIEVSESSRVVKVAVSVVMRLMRCWGV